MLCCHGDQFLVVKLDAQCICHILSDVAPPVQYSRPKVMIVFAIMCSSHVDLLPESSGCCRSVSGFSCAWVTGCAVRCGARLWQPYLRHPHPAGLVHGVHAAAPACGQLLPAEADAAVLGCAPCAESAVGGGGVGHTVVGSARRSSRKNRPAAGHPAARAGKIIGTRCCPGSSSHRRRSGRLAARSRGFARSAMARPVK